MAEENIPDFDVSEEMIGDLETVVAESEKIDRIVRVSAEAGWHLGIIALARAISTKLQMPVNEIRNAIMPLLNLYRFKINLKRSSSDTVNILTRKLRQTAEKSNVELAEKLDNHANRFCAVLDKLTPDHPFLIARKAFDVATTRQYEIKGMKVFTDIRPVFNEAADAILESIVSHVLHIHYHDGSDHHVIQFDLDAIDVTSLKEMLARAEKKAMVVKRDFKSQKWPTFVFRESIDPKE